MNRLRRWSYDPFVSRFDLVDRAAVISELRSYINAVSSTTNSEGISVPAVGIDMAIELTERIRPILDTLYPEWRHDELGNYRPYSAEREASQRLVGRLKAHDEVIALLGGLDATPFLSAGSLHQLVWQAASAQWETDHRHDAVLAAAKAVNSLLQSKLGRRDLSEVKLIQEAFSEKEPEPGKSRLRFPDVLDDQTRENMRLGVMSFGVGCFKAIRNPVGHLPNDEVELSEQEALERLTALSLLARWIDQAVVAKVV
jgi:uncharacterized protein (TIGR02391 family)